MRTYDGLVLLLIYIVLLGLYDICYILLIHYRTMTNKIVDKRPSTSTKELLLYIYSVRSSNPLEALFSSKSKVDLESCVAYSEEEFLQTLNEDYQDSGITILMTIPVKEIMENVTIKDVQTPKHSKTIFFHNLKYLTNTYISDKVDQDMVHKIINKYYKK